MSEIIDRARLAVIRVIQDSDIPVGAHVDSEKIVRAVLEAIREPTDAMVNSPMARCYNDGAYADKEVRRIYSAMIDVALQRCP